MIFQTLIFTDEAKNKNDLMSVRFLNLVAYKSIQIIALVDAKTGLMVCSGVGRWSGDKISEVCTFFNFNFS